MQNTESEIFDLNIGGRDYTVEFNRDSIREADSLGAASNDKMGIFDRTALVLYAGLKMHHPATTLSKVSRKDGLLEQALDGEYDFESFVPIMDEFNRQFNASFTGHNGKKIVSRRQVATKAAK